ncbi:hypothetical protein H340_18536 [Streptomyces mobaraensis NBRC 13819 = DSM 40847]|uniref:Uncharacterized protein n=1 Tax=Streptomyces mobaraensis (strain ATCC 29032 / DSM 40847 / JCM 4168 / NBRC 13819 / NCIMB 11159 / IPCR 16-22) TaxID=1223523 RepID=M3C4W3_STRM1|nr:hypothetical protein H340_18536 [Streptomyces mobaraensis NBRC 13819 = DSM 40847]
MRSPTGRGRAGQAGGRAGQDRRRPGQVPARAGEPPPHPRPGEQPDGEGPQREVGRGRGRGAQHRPGQYVVRIVRADGHPQHGGEDADRQRHGGQPRPGRGDAHGERRGEGRVVAGEGPVAGRRAGVDGSDAAQGPARALLVDGLLQQLADRVGGDRGRAGEQDGRERRDVAAAQRGPARPQQQQSQDDQGPLGGEGEHGAHGPGGVPRRAGDGAVEGGGGAAGDLGPAVGSGSAGCGPGQYPGRGGQDGEGAERPGGAAGAGVSCAFHTAGR